MGLQTVSSQFLQWFCAKDLQWLFLVMAMPLCDGVLELGQWGLLVARRVVVVV